MSEPSHRFSLSVHRDHRRSFAENLYVYPVISRRSKGVSIGINLNPDKICNFDCIYCQVDRTTAPTVRDVDLNRLRDELEAMLGLVLSGDLFTFDSFRETPTHLRRLNDIAFSGDGEPTTSPCFPQAVNIAVQAKRKNGLHHVKLVLITNATMLRRDRVRQALAELDANNGEVWAKLDAGTEAYYQQIERTTIPLKRVLENILDKAQSAPLVIQSLFMRMHGTPPPAEEIAVYCDRLNEIKAAGGGIKLVQVYTVARQPAEAFVSALSDREVDEIVEKVRQRTGLMVEAFYGG